MLSGGEREQELGLSGRHVSRRYLNVRIVGAVYRDGVTVAAYRYAALVKVGDGELERLGGVNLKGRRDL